MNSGEDLWPRVYGGRRVGKQFEPGLVSVIVPTFNRERLVTEAMDSVWAQTYRPIELIVVDDGSTDGTVRVVEQWGREHASDAAFTCRVVRQENRKVSAARDLGAVESRGEYIQFLDSDDLLYPQRLAVMVGVARDTPGFQVAVSDVLRTSFDGQAEMLVRQPDVTAPDRLRQVLRTPLAPYGAFYGRGFMRRVGFFNPEISWGEDWEQGIRVAVACDPTRCRMVRQPLANWRTHGGDRMTDVIERGASDELLAPTVRALLRRPELSAEDYGTCVMVMLQLFMGRPRRGLVYLKWSFRLPCRRCLKLKLWMATLIALVCGPASAARILRWQRRRRPGPLRPGRAWVPVHRDESGRLVTRDGKPAYADG